MTIFVYLWPFFFFAEVNGASQCCGFLAFLARFFLSQLQSFTDEPTLLHSGSYNHIAYWARGNLVQLRQFDVCVASSPHRSQTVLLASSYFFFFFFFFKSEMSGFNGSVSQALLQVIEPSCIWDSVVACNRFLHHMSVFVCM